MIIKGIKKILSDVQKDFKEEKSRLLIKRESKREKVFANREVQKSQYKTILPKRKTYKGGVTDKLAARMLVMGFEPYDIAKTLRLGSYQLRKRINEDEDFRQAIKGFEEELFGAMENKQKHLMKEALDKLSELLKHKDPGINLECIDRVFRIHGKYVERTEDMTPVERKMTPEVAERILEKGIEYLRLSKEPKLIERDIIETKEQ